MTKFNLYVGLNDKDTKQQEISTLDAYKIMTNYLMSKVDGATITESKGIYKHDNGEIVIENTLVCSLLFVDRQTVLEILDDFKALFNQESIVLEEINTNSDMI